MGGLKLGRGLSDDQRSLGFVRFRSLIGLGSKMPALYGRRDARHYKACRCPSLPSDNPVRTAECGIKTAKVQESADRLTLDIGAWSFLGAWSLELGILPIPSPSVG